MDINEVPVSEGMQVVDISRHPWSTVGPANAGPVQSGRDFPGHREDEADFPGDREDEADFPGEPGDPSDRPTHGWQDCGWPGG